MENPIRIDDLGWKPTIFGNIHTYCRVANSFFTTMLRKGVLMSSTSGVGTDEDP